MLTYKELILLCYKVNKFLKFSLFLKRHTLVDKIHINESPLESPIIF